MAAVLPGAPDLETYLANLRAGVDAITDVPASRWDAEFYDPAAAKTRPGDRMYCHRGGFVDDVAFDPMRFGIMPMAVGRHRARAAGRAGHRGRGDRRRRRAGLARRPREGRDRARARRLLQRRHGAFRRPGPHRQPARRDPARADARALRRAARGRARLLRREVRRDARGVRHRPDGAEPGRLAHREPARPGRPGLHRRRGLRLLADRRRPRCGGPRLRALRRRAGRRRAPLPRHHLLVRVQPARRALAERADPPVPPRRRRDPDRRGHRDPRAQATGRRRATNGSTR